MIVRGILPLDPQPTQLAHEASGTLKKRPRSERATVRAVTRFTSLSGCLACEAFLAHGFIPFSRGLFFFQAAGVSGAGSAAFSHGATTFSTSSTPVFLRLENSCTVT